MSRYKTAIERADAALDHLAGLRRLLASEANLPLASVHIDRARDEIRELRGAMLNLDHDQARSS